MPELSIDVTVANRFISSLSKSLQALCHGCMEFDSGIEIVGYINVNIDSGSKVDYVLNEKVLKGTTNSMTFVSNSFLAKKESQKQTRENACSPIPHPQPVTPYASRVRGTPPGPQHHKAALQHPLHPQAHWGTQKRSWADDWRSPKRHRTQNLPAETQPFTDQNSQQSFPSSTSHAYPETGFKQPHMSSSTSDGENTDSTQQLLMSIKKEALEADNQNTTDTEQLASEHSPDDQAHDSAQERMSNIQIKTDPDGTNTQSGKASPTDSSNAAPSENTDFKGTFLEPSSKDPPGLAVEGDNLDTDTELPATFDQGLESASTKELALSDEVNVAGTSAANSTDDDVGESAESEPPSHAPIEYDQAADDGSYSQSAYEDAAEGSSDAGQFEVIEIDDEDEDVQAMFGDPRAAHQLKQKCYQFDRKTRCSSSRPGANYTPQSSVGLGKSEMYYKYPLFQEIRCLYCPEVMPERDMKEHVSKNHGTTLPFSCSLCGRGYNSYSGLSSHMDMHGGKTVTCPVCDKKFSRKFALKRHMRVLHNSSQCSKCSAIMKTGREYNEHLLYCTVTT